MADLDLGSFVEVMDDNGTMMFAGLKADFSKLPTTNIPTWKKAVCIDTKEVYIFEATSKQWYKWA